MKVAVIRFSSLGDVILASSVIDPLFSAGYEIDFLTFKPFDQLFIHDHRIKSVIALKKDNLKTLKQIKNFSEKLKNYDLIIDLHSNLRSYLIGFFSTVPVLRYKKSGIKRRLYTKPIFRKFLKDQFNVVGGYMKTLEPLGIKEEKPRPSIVLKKEEITEAKSFLPENFVVIGAGARYKNKSYPYFPQLSEMLMKEGFSVALIGSEEDKKIDSRPYPEGTIDLRGRLDLRKSLSVIKNAKLTISNDSAVAHMSRAVETPVVMIYGATSPYFGFYPFEDEGTYIYKNISCQPCDIHGKKKCKKERPECLEISPEEVFSKALNIIQNSL